MIVSGIYEEIAMLRYTYMCVCHDISGGRKTTKYDDDEYNII